MVIEQDGCVVGLLLRSRATFFYDLKTQSLMTRANLAI
jgi:hypothetical protein